ncbi:preprotein translocase subunit SecY, partial [Vibrio parahaemolyticus]|nr:preprotein translocase subunit SecY [Vibrio parahaemolyticus]
SMIIYLVIMLLTVAFVVALQQGERKIPVQYAKRVVGRKMYGGQNTHIPIKVLMAGVIPVIFASSLLSLPQTISLFWSGGVSNWITKYLTPQGTVGLVVYLVLNVVLIIFFTYFYT